MQVGEQVEVRTKFDHSWASGFEIAEVADEGYKLRRHSDGTVLPELTTPTDVRRVPGP